MNVIGTETPLVVPDTPGTAAITYPVGGENWFVGTQHDLTADAVDADGIASVEFWWQDQLTGFEGTASLVSGSTYHLLWTPGGTGTDAPLWAKLTDIRGNVTWSAEVLITVNTPG